MASPRIPDTELLFLILYYQQKPSDPRATAALLAPLEGLIKTISSKRVKPLGGPQDARQETIAAVLEVAQKYNPKNTKDVEMRMLGDVADKLLSKVRSGVKIGTQEQHIEVEPFFNPSYELARLLLEKAQANNILQPRDLPLLLLDQDGSSYVEIAELFDLKPEQVRKRIKRAMERLQEWVNSDSEKS